MVATVAIGANRAEEAPDVLIQVVLGTATREVAGHRLWCDRPVSEAVLLSIAALVAAWLPCFILKEIDWTEGRCDAALGAARPLGAGDAALR